MKKNAGFAGFQSLENGFKKFPIIGKIVFWGFLVLGCVAGVQAATYYMDPDGSGIGDTWGEACPSWQELIEADWPLEDGDIVLCSNGVYDVGGIVAAGATLTNRFCITSAVTVMSVNGPEVTFIKGASSGGELGAAAIRCAYLTNGAQLIGFTLTNGYTMATGSGVLNQDGGGAFLNGGGTISSCVVVNCHGDGGGGIGVRGSTATIKSCSIVSNSAEHTGGGVIVGSASRASVIDCTIAYNTAVLGGGLENNSETYVENCTIVSNVADGAMTYGGGVGNSLGTLVIVNSTISGNSSANVGGGLYDGDNTYLLNTIVINNSATSSGADIHCDWGAGCYGYYSWYHDVDGTVNVQANAPNVTDAYTAGNLLALADNGGFTKTMKLAGTAPAAGTGAFAYTNSTVGYYFVDDVATSHTLTNWSVNPSVTAGDKITVDQRGVTRAAPVSMGAYAVASGPPSTIYVDASRADDSGNGESWATAKKTIQAGVDAVSTNGTVWVTNGVYNLGGTNVPGLICTNRVCISNPITLRSVNGPELTFISGAPGSNGSNDLDSIRGVFMTNGCSLIGFTITNGYTVPYNSGNHIDASGAGVLISTNCVVSNVVLQGNSTDPSAWGGGALLWGGGTLNNSRIIGNRAGSGGGVEAVQGGAINNCEISGNENCEGGGGAGAAFYFGGIMRNCTVTDNYTPYRGGGVMFAAGGAVYNSIIFGNTADQADNDIYNTGGTVGYSCASDGVTHGTDGCITNNPLFVDTATSNYQLQATSPCVNTGDNTYAPTNVTPVDLAGNPRIIYSTVDMGAYEYAAYYVDASKADDSGDGYTWGTAKKTIQAAVDIAVDGTTVWVTNGVYDAGGAVTPGGILSNRVVITKAVTVCSVNGPEVTTIVGGGVYGSDTGIRGVFMTNGCTLAGFTITNGNTRSSAGDIIPDWCGGGVWLSDGCVVSNCLLTHNRAKTYGGGAFAFHGGLVLNCEVVTNRALDGAGVYLYGSGEAANCLVRDCVADNTGGGIYLYDGGTMNNCTVARNTANDSFMSGEAAGVHCENSTINNSIIMLNLPFRNLKRDNSNVRYTDTTEDVTNGVDGCIAADPLFTDASTNDFTLQSSSPCKNAGNNTYAPTNVSPYDVAGNPRIVGGTVDMGAYEVQTVVLPDVVYVDASVGSSGAGTNWATAFKTIQEGVDAVSTTGTVWVTNGVYDAGGTVTPGYALTNRVCITNAIVLQSVNGPVVTVIKGAAGSNGSNDVDSIRGVFMDGGCTLNGFTVTNGYTMASGNVDYDRSGGGVWMTTNCTASNLIVRGNSARRGGGVCVEGAGAALNNSTVSGNLAMDSVGGGGILLYSGALVNNCTLNGNSSGGDGGGALLFDGGTLNNCLVSENTANTESASIGGGGIYIYLDGIVNNCTVISNAANGTGDGVYMDSGEVNNCIVWEGNNNAIYNDFGSPVRYTCASDGVTHGTDGCITNNPLFVDAAGGNFKLQDSSACINTGDDAYAPTNVTPVDLAGVPRILDGTVDMGAYEFVANYYVNASRADDSGDGYSWATAKKTIQAAVDIAEAGKTVLVTNGVYDENSAVTPGSALTNRVMIDKAITVRSVNGPDVTTIVGADDSGGLGNAAIRGVFMTNGCSLIGFTITNGWTMALDAYNDLNEGGGGVYTADTGCIISNCVVSGCHAGCNGGGVVGSGDVVDSILDGNVCGIAGGGFYGAVSDGRIWNSILRNNTAAKQGGGAAYYAAVDNCLIENNTVTDFGMGGGGGLYAASGTARNCTIVKNCADQEGAITSMGGSFYNCVIDGNTNSAGAVTNVGAVGTLKYSCSTGFTGGEGCITNDPQFVDFAGGNYQLQQTSPCINAGDNTYAPTNITPSDLAGKTRIMFTTVDMGAYERQFSLSTDSGRYSGGNTITITNGLLGADDITNVLVSGSAATIVDQGATWVRITLGPALDADTSGDIVVQSTTLGSKTLSGAYTYNNRGFIGENQGWMEVAGLPVLLGSGGAVTYSGTLYSVGGSVSSTPSTNVYAYDGSTWQLVAGLPQARRSMGCVVYHGKLYAVGGHDGTSGHDNVYVYDGTSWSESVALPAANYEMGCAVFNDEIYCIGGGGGGAEKNVVWSFDGSSWTVETSLPATRTSLRAETLNGLLYSLGGYGSGSAQTNVWSFDGSSWTEVPGYPSICSAMGSAVREGLIYSVGGNGAGGHLTNCWTFNGLDWTEIAGLEGTRYDPAAATYNGQVFAIGGYHVGSGACVSNVYVYPGYFGGISPSSGSYLGSYQVTISGTNLFNGIDTDISSVTVCGVTAMVDSVAGTTQIVVLVDSTTNAVSGDVVVDSISYGTTTKNNSFEYLKSDQTITFGVIAAMTYGEAAFDPGATATSSLTVDYTTSDSAVATNQGSLIYMTGAGTCDVVAVQSGNGVYNPAVNVTNALVVGPKALTVTGAVAQTKGYDGTTAATITGGSLVGVINSDTVTLANNSTGTFAQATVGSDIAVTSFMTLAGGDAGSYTVSQPTLEADIIKGDQNIDFPAIPDQEETETISVSATASSGLAVTFAVGSGPATLSGGTNLSFSTTGVVSVVASQAGDESWNATAVTNTFNVTWAKVLSLPCSTYLGGSGSETGKGIAVDESGNTYVLSYTSSTNFPVTNAFQSTIGDPAGFNYFDVSLTKFAPDGSTVIYSTYLGGSYYDYAYGIAVHTDETVYVAGYTQSTNFPVANAYQGAYNGGRDGFLSRFSADGQSLIYSTYFGGSSDDRVYGLAVGPDGSAFITGWTQSDDFPLVNAIQTNRASYEAYVTRFSPEGNVIFSTLLGGSSVDYGYGITVDSNLTAFITGYTQSGDFPITNAYQTTMAGVVDAYVTRIAADGSCLLYSTYLGGANSVETGYAIDVDKDSKAYIAGYTESDDFPVTNAYQSALAGDEDAFVVVLSASGSNLLYGTYLGGSAEEDAYGIAADDYGRVYVTGRTFSDNFPTKRAVQTSRAGDADAFLTRLETSGTNLLCSTYLGGNDVDYGYAVVMDTNGTVCVVGYTESEDFPTANAFQPVYGGGSRDMFVSRFDCLPTAPEMSVLGIDGAAVDSSAAATLAAGTDFGGVLVGSVLTNTFSITNNSFSVLHIDGVSTNGTGASAFTVSAIPSQIAAGSVSNFTIVFDASNYGSYAADLSIANNSTNTPYVVKLSGICYSLSTNVGPYAGGNAVTLTNGTLGSGSDITNIVVGGVSTTNITAQGVNWVTFVLPTNTAGTKDITVQGNTATSTFANAYTYNLQGEIGLLDWSVWQEVNPIPAVRQSLGSAAVLSNAFYIGGGRDSSLRVTNVFRMSADGTWSEVDGLPVAADFVPLVTYRGEIYALGGRTAIGPRNNVYRYNGETWVSAPGLPEARCYGGAAALGDDLFYFGGMNAGSAIVDTTYRYDGTSWTSVTAMPAALRSFGYAVYDGAIYTMGGYDGSSLTNVYRFDGTSWTQVVGLPAAVNENCAAALDGKLYSMKGSATNVYCFDGSSWSSAPATDGNLASAAAGTFDGFIYVVGGYDGSSVSDKTWRYPYGESVSPASGSWTGGYPVTISGTNLGNGVDITNVTLCGVTAAIQPGQSATQLVVLAGAATVGQSGDVVVQSTSFGTTTKSNAFTYIAPTLSVLGTNGAAITSDGATSLADGSKFYATQPNEALTYTFGLTNTGNDVLNISGWTTNEANADLFIVSTIPTPIAVGGVTNFTVTYTPVAVGSHTAQVSIASDDPTSPFLFNLVGSCFAASTNVGPYAGGNTVTITNGYFGTITNILVGQTFLSVVPTSSGENWFTIEIPSALASGPVDFIVQTSNTGDTILRDAYTYNPAGSLPDSPLTAWITLTNTWFDGTNGMRFTGEASMYWCGSAVSSAGDINNDGLDDMLIGADFARNRLGYAYMVYGQQNGYDADTWLSNSNGWVNGTNAFSVLGTSSEGYLGYSASSAGDVNGDGYDDMLIGAYQYTVGSAFKAGQAFLLYGHSNECPAEIRGNSTWMGEATNAVKFGGVHRYGKTAASLSPAGDVNGDGLDDFIIGSPQADSAADRGDAGESYLIYGSATGYANSITLTNTWLDGANGMIFAGAKTNDQSGTSVSSAGDVNGDGFDDLLIGAQYADPNGLDAAGEAYLIFGSSSLSATVVLTNTWFDGTNGVLFAGAYTNISAGCCVSAAGDMNQDGLDDIMISASTYDEGTLTNAGAVYLVYGSTNLPAHVTLTNTWFDGVNGVQLTGAGQSIGLGNAMSGAGDVNGDGLDDLLIAGSWASPEDRTGAGETYLVYGQTRGLPASISLSSTWLDGTNGVLMAGAKAQDFSGKSVGFAGDVNADGFEDMLIGAYQADPEGNSAAGEAYLMYGAPFPVSPFVGSWTGGYEVVISGQNIGNSDITSITLCGLTATINSQVANRVWITAPASISGQSGDVVVQSISYGTTTKSDGFTYVAPNLNILGTNGEAIASSEAISLEKGSKFYATQPGVALTYTFAITNTGNDVLSISGFTTNGVDRDLFTLSGVPSSIAVGGVDSFTVEYNPATVGSHTATVSFASDDPVSPFLFNVGGSCFEVSTNNGPYAGGNSITITNGTLGNGSDITNVTVGGIVTTITGQGANWVAITLPTATSAGAKDIVIQSGSVGDTTFAGAYTYNPSGQIGGTTYDWSAWEEVTGLPAPRNDFSAAVYDGNLYTFGGSFQTNVYRYDGTNWTEITGLPGVRNASAAGVVGGSLYVAGGYSGAFSYHTNTYRFNGSGWDEVNGLPDTRAGTAFGVLNGDLVMVGGRSSFIGPVNGAYRFDGTNWFSFDPLLQPTANMGSAVLGSRMYSIGGYMTGLPSITNCYEHNGSDWSSIVGYPVEVVAPCASGLSDKLYVYGGRTDAAAYTNANYYDGTNWVAFAGLPAARGYAASAMFNGQLYSIGGEDDLATAQTNVYRCPAQTTSAGISPASGSWTGGYQVVINGSNLGNGSDITNVTLAGVGVSSIDSQSATQVVVTAEQAITPGQGDVVVYSVSYGATTKSNAFTYIAPNLSVLGTNGAAITSSADFQSANGTKFYPIQPGAALTNTFAVTNSGNDVLSISDWTTNGLDADLFTLSGVPSSVAVGSVETFTVVYDPASIGSHTAAVSFVSGDPASPFLLNLGGSCFDVSTNVGPYAGGNTLTITNGYFGNITNVLISQTGMSALPSASGDNWFTITLPAASSAGSVDITVQTSGNGDILLADAYAYNPAGYIGQENGTWTEVEPLDMTSILAGHAVLSNMLYCVGGYDKFGTVLTNSYAFDGESWTAIAGPSTEQVDHTVTALNGKLYSIGGNSASDRLSNVWSFSGTDWTSEENLPVELSGHASAALNGSIYVFGGVQGAGGGTENTNVWRFDGSSWEWVASCPCSPNSAAAVTYNNKIYVLSGTSGSENYTNCYSYDGVSETLTAIAGPSTGFANWVSGVIDGKIQLAGGKPDGSTYSSTNVYRFDGTTWVQATGLPEARGWGAGGVLNDAFYYAGGILNLSTACTNVYRYGITANGITPASGSWTGNYAVAISGTNLCNGTLSDITQVTLAGISAAVQNVYGSTQILVVADASIFGFGTGDVVVVSTDFGTTTKSDAFEYLKEAQTITFDTIANKTYGSAAFDPAATASSALSVSYASSDANVATVSVHNIYITGTGTCDIVASQPGNAFYFAAPAKTNTLTVTQKVLTVTGTTASNKVYDATQTAWLSGALLQGAVSGDDVALANATTGTFAQATTGTSIAVTTHMTLTGTRAGQYTLSQPSGIAADITARELTVTGAVASTKTYDASTAATLSSGGGLVGVQGGDGITLGNNSTGTFASADAGSAIAVTSYMTISGPKVANYTLTQPTLSADITKADQAITFANPGNQFWTNKVGLSATADSGLPVVFDVSSGPALLSDGTNLSFTGYGTVEITATQTGNPNWNMAMPVVRQFSALGPEFILLGTNGAVIESSVDFQSANGTDFGEAIIGLDILTNTFTLTNNGTANLTISSIATNGSPSFSLDLTSSVLSVSSVVEIPITFNPQTGGSNTTSFTFTFDGTNSPYTLNVGGLGLGGGIALATQTLSYTCLYRGADPASQSIMMSNVGLSSFTFTNNIPASWLSATPSYGVVPLAGSTLLTFTVESTNINAGTYVTTNVIQSIDATNAPQDIVVSLTVGKSPQTIAFANPGSQLTTNTTPLTATASSGLPLTYAIASGPAVLGYTSNTTYMTYTNSGSVIITAAQSGNSNYLAATTVTQTFAVTKAVASVTLSNLVQSYNGAPKSVTATSEESISSYSISYSGSTNAPVLAGSYPVVATVVDPIWQGGATNVLTIDKAVPQVDPWPAASGITYGQTLSQSTLSGGRAYLTNGLLTVCSEHFDYADGALLGGQNGGHGWAGAWNATYSGELQMTTPGYTYPGLDAAGNAAKFGTGGAQGISEAARQLELQSSGVVYVQCLFNAGSSSIGGGTPQLRLAKSGFGWTGGLGGNNGSSFVSILNAQENPVGVSTAPLNALNLLVYRIDYAAGTSALWVNPDLSSFDYANPSTPADATAALAPIFDTLAIYFRNGASIDEITVMSDRIPGVFAYVNESLMPPAGTNNQATSFTPSDSANIAIITGAVPVSVDCKNLTVTNAAAQNKTYDATIAATLSTGTLVGVVGSDTVMLANNTTGTFAQTTIGSAIAVTSYMTLSGAASGNYTLSQPVLSADITTKSLTVTGAVAQSKTYDGTTAATLSAGGGLVGIQGSDVITLGNNSTGTFATVNAGSAIAVTSYMTISGIPAANYTLSQPTLTADITKKNQTISFSNPGNQFWTNKLGLAATASSSGTVTFAVIPGSPATINNATNLSFTGYGSVKIAASQSGNSNYNPAPTVTNTFDALGPEFILLGTNGAVIESGGSFQLADGTDFGEAIIGQDILTNTFTLTNSGTANLTISSIATNGSPSFTLSLTSSVLSASSVVSIPVVFDPQIGGSNTTAFTFSFDGTNSPYMLNVGGMGLGGGIDLSATSLVYNGVYGGSNLPVQSLVISNVGVSALSFTNVLAQPAWLAASPLSGTLSIDAALSMAYAVDITDLNAGAYGVTGTIISADSTNSPQTYTVQLTVAQAPQTIDFREIPTQYQNNTVELRATSESGLPISFTIVSGPAVLSSNNWLSFTNVGEVSISAAQGGDSNWLAAATVTNVFMVTAWAVPKVDDPSVSNRMDTSAMLGALVQATNGSPVQSRGVVWSTNSDVSLSSGAIVQERGAFGNGAYSLSVTGLPSGSHLYYRGFAVNSAGTNSTTIDSFWTLPAQVSGLNDTNERTTTFDTSWQGVFGATNYLLDAAYDAQFSNGVPGYTQVSMGTNTSLTLTGLTYGAECWWRVRAQNAGGLGRWSLTNSVDLPDAGLEVLGGTNLDLVIADGASPSTEFGTDFGYVPTNTPVSSVLGIRNNEPFAQVMQHVSLSGGTSAFSLSNAPVQVGSGATALFSLNFESGTAMVYTSRLQVVSGTINTSISFGVQGAVRNPDYTNVVKRIQSAFTDWTLQPWQGLLVGTLEICNQDGSEDKYYGPFRYAVRTTDKYRLVDPDGIDSDGRDYVDITEQVEAQIGNNGLAPGVCVTVSNITMYSFNLSIPQDLDEAVWATIMVNKLAPTAYASSFRTKPNTVYSGQLRAENPVKESDTTFSLLMAPTSGVAVVNADGSYIYTPATNYVGRDMFTYRVDTPYGKDSADVSIQVSDAVSMEWMLLLLFDE